LTTLSSKLGLIKPSTSDRFSTADIASNWDTLDGAPGFYICTSTTRPAGWGPTQTGRFIYETDTLIAWQWNGSAFVRQWARGKLASSSRTSDFSTPSTTPQTVVSVSTAVPAGGRDIEVVVTAYLIEGSTGRVGLQITRDAVQLLLLDVGGQTSGTASTSGTGRTFIVHDNPGPGTFTYALKAFATATYGGTVFVRAAVNNACEIFVKEI
jgi:hypothetical protein